MSKCRPRMLGDRARTRAYKAALEGAGLAGKTVLDVGAGTCILSIFAARAGARHVYAVEASSLAAVGRAIVAANGLAGCITVLQGRIEDIQLPAKVDAIVSEWMGYALLYEDMLPSVLAARDRWLAPGGVMLPSHATLWAAPLCDEGLDERRAADAAFWADVCGVDMSAMLPGVSAAALADPVVAPFPPAAALSRGVQLRRLELASMRPDELLPWEARVTLGA